MQNRIIRPTRTSDIPRVMEVFRQAKEIMRADGNMLQWAGEYPSEEALTIDMERGASYVVEDGGEITGTFAFVTGLEPTYGKIYGGAWLDDTLPYATIHRIASTKNSHGIFRDCIEWSWDHIKNLRIDTHRDNRIMQHCIAKAGFTYCGIIYLSDGDERLAYQKLEK